MTAALTNHLWQSTLFALAAGALTLAFRRNRAQIRYWLWFSASMKFLIPFSLLARLGNYMPWLPAAKSIAPPAISFAIGQAAQPFPDAVTFVPPAPGALHWTPIAMLALWICGFAAIAPIRLRGWLRVRAALRDSARLEISSAVEIRSAPGLLGPGVVGFLRPVLLVPEGIAERLTPAQFEAVLAHELCHVRRRDNLASGLHMIVEALFWFHPLVWWIGARLVEERERACDEGVLSLGKEPRVYAEAIVNVCKLYAEPPLVCVSGVTGADLKKRIEAIMMNRGALRLSAAKKVALACVAMFAVALPVFVGAVHAQSTVKQFEVASIRACKAGQPAVGGDAARGGRGGGAGATSPDRLSLPCLPVTAFIRTAYIEFANGQFNSHSELRLEGGPGWIGSDRYAINAKAEGAPGQMMMRGPMLEALLEDRFKLRCTARPGRLRFSR